MRCGGRRRPWPANVAPFRPDRRVSGPDCCHSPGAFRNVTADDLSGLDNVLDQRLAINGVVDSPAGVRVVEGRAVVLGQKVEMIQGRAAVDGNIGVFGKLFRQLTADIGNDVHLARAQRGDTGRLFADGAVA